MVDVELVPLDWLKAHEQIRPLRLNQLRDKLEVQGYVHKPLLVDRETGCILDGHHRFRSAHMLGLKRMPCLMFDYLDDDRITVDVWKGGEVDRISKRDVIDRALEGRLYTPKTSRHVIPFPVPRLRVPLEVLRDDATREPMDEAWLDTTPRSIESGGAPSA